MVTDKNAHYAFIAHLERYVREKNLGALAALRRGLGKVPGTVREMDRSVLSAVPADATGRQEDAYYLVGALFANWHQGKDGIEANPPANFGDSLRVLVNREAEKSGSREEAEKRIEKRLVALLNCHRDDLPEHLRSIICLLKSHDVAVNWVRLLEDILYWEMESRSIQRNWARHFWRGYREKEQNGSDNTATPEENNTEDD